MNKTALADAIVQVLTAAMLVYLSSGTDDVALTVLGIFFCGGNFTVAVMRILEGK